MATRTNLIRRAHAMPKNSTERRAILASLDKQAANWGSEDALTALTKVFAEVLGRSGNMKVAQINGTFITLRDSTVVGIGVAGRGLLTITVEAEDMDKTSKAFGWGEKLDNIAKWVGSASF